MKKPVTFLSLFFAAMLLGLAFQVSSVSGLFNNTVCASSVDCSACNNCLNNARKAESDCYKGCKQGDTACSKKCAEKGSTKNCPCKGCAWRAAE